MNWHDDLARARAIEDTDAADRRSGRRMAVVIAVLFIAVAWFATDGGKGSMPEPLPVTYEEVGE